MSALEPNEFDCGVDDVYNEMVEPIAQIKAVLEEGQHLTDNKRLQDNLQSEDVKIESLTQTLDKKEKQLRELNEQLKRKKLDAGQYRNQRSHTFDVIAEIFKDTQKFSSKSGQEISETFNSLGFDIESDCNGDQATVKIQKNGDWFEFGLNEHLKLTLTDMNPRHIRFDEIKILFDETQNIVGLFSIYNWPLNE